MPTRWLRIFVLSIAAICAANTSSIGGTRSFGPFKLDASEPTVIRMSGRISVDDALNFRRVLQNAPQARLVVLDSLGGSLYAALLIADDIYERKLSTMIPENAVCASACSFMFFAGLERQALGKLGVHQMVGGDVAGTQVAVSDIIDLLARFEVPTDVLAIMFRTPAASMHYFTIDEIEIFNINRSHKVPDGNFGDYWLASCAGWNGTIQEIIGKDTREARMSGIVSEPDIVEYCERDPGGVTIRWGGTKTIGECVEGLSSKTNVRLRSTANCETGTLRFFYGSGAEQNMRLPLPADRSCASGLPPLIEQFRTLCPRNAERFDLSR